MGLVLLFPLVVPPVSIAGMWLASKPPAMVVHAAPMEAPKPIRKQMPWMPPQAWKLHQQ